MNTKVHLDDERGEIIVERGVKKEKPEDSMHLRCPACGCTLSVIERDERGRIMSTFCSTCGCDTTYHLYS